MKVSQIKYLRARKTDSGTPAGVPGAPSGAFFLAEIAAANL
jgi:hypothetical protein